MFLLYFLILVFCVIVGMMLYYVFKQQPAANPCPEDQPCNKENQRKCNLCRQLKPQCQCHKPCPSC